MVFISRFDCTKEKDIIQRILKSISWWVLKCEFVDSLYGKRNVEDISCKKKEENEFHEETAISNDSCIKICRKIPMDYVPDIQQTSSGSSGTTK